MIYDERFVISIFDKYQKSLIMISWTITIGFSRTVERIVNIIDLITTESIVLNSLQLKRFLVSHSFCLFDIIRAWARLARAHILRRIPQCHSTECLEDNNIFASQHSDAYFVINQVRKNIWCTEINDN